MPLLWQFCLHQLLQSCAQRWQRDNHSVVIMIMINNRLFMVPHLLWAQSAYKDISIRYFITHTHACTHARTHARALLSLSLLNSGKELSFKWNDFCLFSPSSSQMMNCRREIVRWMPQTNGRNWPLPITAVTLHLCPTSATTQWPLKKATSSLWR